MRATLRENFGEAYSGVVKIDRRGVRWHQRWSPWRRRVPWGHIESCTAGPDRRPGVARHTHRLVLGHDGGVLEAMVRGPWGAIALVKLRDRIVEGARLTIE